MSVSAISPSVEIGVKSYLEQLNVTSNKSLSHDSFRQNFLNVIFANKQNLLSSGAYSQLSLNGPAAEKYKEYRKLFQPVKMDEGSSSSKTDVDKAPAAQIEEYSGKLAKEIELATMNQLVFSVSTRFGSAINQMVRGQ